MGLREWLLGSWRRRAVLALVIGVPVVRRLLVALLSGRAVPSKLFSAFLDDVAKGRVRECAIAADFFEVRLSEAAAKQLGGAAVYRTDGIPLADREAVIQLLLKHKVPFGALTEKGTLKSLLPMILLMVPFIYLGLAYKMMKDSMNPKADGVGRVKKRRAPRDGDAMAVRFSDVAGIDALRRELAEVVDCIRNPGKYAAVGARMPRGVLISGPSGTGKTMLARAVATEAGIPFIFCSASDFVEMLVGRGASRVRALFTQAQKNTPCIIFVDEIDALAKARGGINSNDEREQTLNQLLTEMDGFEGRTEGVVVIAATNRPEVLDPALTRPGRFDRHVVVPLPDARGRQAILNVHARRVSMSADCDVARVARETEGLSGAELANIVNEAALLAVRAGLTRIEGRHLLEASRRVQLAKAAGPQQLHWLMQQRMRAGAPGEQAPVD